MRLFIVAILFSLMTISCAKPPTQSEIDAAYYGEYPVEYQQIVKNFMEGMLVDPFSTAYKFPNEPQKGWSVTRKGTEYGYITEFYYNSKNRMGGYTGFSHGKLLLRDGNPITVMQ